MHTCNSETEDKLHSMTGKNVNKLSKAIYKVLISLDNVLYEINHNCKIQQSFRSLIVVEM